MTNDTTTLQGALAELGETMADNLVTMGVTDADASDGLTTLANRILDIQGGGGCVMIDLVSDKSALSYYHTESATLTATVTVDGVVKSGESVQFYIDDVAWGSPVTTNASGVATKTYSASGTGDITVKAECRYASETCVIEDCIYWNDGTSTTGLTVDSGVSATIDDGALKITASTSGEKYVRLPVSLANSDNFTFEFEVARSGTTQHFACFVNAPSTANGLWWAFDNSTAKYVGGLTGTSLDKSGVGLSVGDILKYKQDNGVVTLYRNDTVMNTKSSSFPTSPFGMGFYTNRSRVQYLKNIKVKAL